MSLGEETTVARDPRGVQNTKVVENCTKLHSHGKILPLLGGNYVFGIVFTSGDPRPTSTNDRRREGGANPPFLGCESSSADTSAYKGCALCRADGACVPR